MVKIMLLVGEPSIHDIYYNYRKHYFQRSYTNRAVLVGVIGITVIISVGQLEMF